MKQKALLVLILTIFSLLLGSCSMPSSVNTSLESTRIAIAIKQTSMALNQAQDAVVEAAPAEAQPVEAQPQEQATYTPYPTYTSQPVEAPPAEPPTAQPPTAEPPPAEPPPPTPTTEPEPAVSFQDWMKDANILVYDAMYGRGDTPVIQYAVEGLGLGRNVKHVNDAIGDFIKEMNSAMNWDLIIVGSEFRSQVQGEVFDILVGPIDRGSAIIIETWYIDQVYNGRIRPVMQRCGITFHQDWWRRRNYLPSELNDFFVYLLEPSDPVFSTPNIIGPLSPYGVRWVEDVGDTVETIPGSGAVLLAGRLPKEHNSYGLITKCLDGRMIWQTFSTHDYNDQEMINLWQNYIYNALMARYESLQ